jgi:hypothetical protein
MKSLSRIQGNEDRRNSTGLQVLSARVSFPSATFDVPGKTTSPVPETHNIDPG